MHLIKKATLAIGIVLLLAGVINRGIVYRTETAYPPSGQFISIDGVRYHYRMGGKGPVVVLLHGTGGSLEDYQTRILDDLMKDFRVIAIDRPGHGYSERPTGDVGTPITQARIVHEILRGLKVERAGIVGHSWSGAVALAYALDFPAETIGVVLLQGTVYRPTTPIAPLVRLLGTPVVGPLVAYTIVPWAGRGSIRRTLESAFAPEPVPAEYLGRAQAMWTRPDQARAIAIDAKRRSETIDALSARYPELTRPVILVVGTSDRFINPEEQALRFAREHPSATLRVIPGAGHQIPQTQPDAVIEAVRALLKQASETSGL